MYDNNMNQMNNGMPNNQPMGQPVQPTQPVQPMNQPMGTPEPVPTPMPMNNNVPGPVQPVQPAPMPQQPVNNFQQPQQPVQPVQQSSYQQVEEPQTNYYQQPYNNQVPINNSTPVKKGNGDGFIVGIVLILLILGVVALLIFNPFEKKYDAPSGGSTPSGSTTPSKNNGSSTTPSGGNNQGSGTIIPQEDKTPTTKTATCTQTVTGNGVKTATDIKITDDGVNTKIHFDYTISRTDGKSYDEAGRQQMANNIKKSVTELYSQFGNITGFKSSLVGGKVLISFDIASESYDDLEGLRDAFVSSGATCK